jgi:alpha-galactosidase
VPLLRSDYPLTAFDARSAPGQQCQTYGMSLWIPYHGTGAPFGDVYTMRSSYAPAFRMGWDARQQDTDHDLLRRTVAEFRQVADLMLGDFHPLTEYSLADNVWLAWQFDSPEKGAGFVQAFRRPACEPESVVLRLRGLDAEADYTVTDLDEGVPRQAKGSELARGWAVSAAVRPAARLLVYTRVPGGR